jgi:iron complex outermembrane receptor protein
VWKSTYEIDRPYQEVTHDIGVLSTELDGEWGSLETIYAFQINLRKEYEHVRMNRTHPQYDFTLRTHSLDSTYLHPEADHAFGKLEGGLGLQGGFQENVYTGLPLIPNFRSFSGGLFAYERLSTARVDFEVGARADALGRAAYINDNSYDAHVRRETLDPENCEQRSQSARCPADYTAASFSMGTLVHAVPDTLDLKLDLSTATRFPNVDELYILGHAPTSPVYANGHPDLEPETIWNASFTTGLRTQIIEAEASVYGQRVDDYIYFAPELGVDGTPRFDVTIRGTWPTYGFQQINANFYGMDGSIDLAPNAPVGLQALGGIVRAESRETGDQLIGTPADHLTLTAIGRPAPFGPLQKIELLVKADLVAKQSLVNPDHDFAPTPEGYTLWGAGIETEVGQKTPVRVGIEAHNLLDTSYREYTSLLRYFGDQPGRDVRVRVGLDF